MKFGCHLSTRGGYAEAARTAIRIGAGAFQYFPKNPRSLNLKALDRHDAEECARLCRERGIASIGHSPYPVNPAAEGERAAVSAACVRNDLEIAEACGSIGTVVHFGTYKGKDPLQGYRNVIEWINRVLADWTGGALLLIENQAGDHGPMGTTPEESAQIRALCERPEAVGFCLDTCHLLASGEWSVGGWDAFSKRCRRSGYWEALKAVHANDSRYPPGSARDRHAPIGEGWIGERGFRELLAAPELRRVPFVLETPAEPDLTHPDQMNRLRRWAARAQEGNE
jgi:deoxyribonuclease-4